MEEKKIRTVTPQKNDYIINANAREEKEKEIDPSPRHVTRLCVHQRLSVGVSNGH
jgi:hypothetical protein